MSQFSLNTGSDSPDHRFPCAAAGAASAARAAAFAEPGADGAGRPREGAWEHNLQTGSAHYSREFSALLGYQPGEMRQQVAMWDHLVHPGDLTSSQILFGIAMERQRRLLERDRTAGERHAGGREAGDRESSVFDFTLRMQHRDGRWMRMRCRGTVGPTWRTLIGSIAPAHGTHSDDLDTGLTQLGDFWQDPLTQLPNRRQLEVRLNHCVALSRRLGHPLTVLAIDLDQFRAVNLHFGRSGGDQVLCEVANRLLGMLREVDIVARDANDRFIVVLNGSGPEDSKRVCRRLENVLAEGIWLLSGEICWVRNTVGLATFPGDAKDGRALVHEAFQRLALRRLQERAKADQKVSPTA